jgi:hypothetical protein
MTVIAASTTGQIASSFGAPLWLVRQIVDGLGVEIPRAGQYRLIPENLLPRVEMQLESRGYRRKEPSDAD